MAHLSDAKKVAVITTYEGSPNITRTAAACGLSRKAVRHTVHAWKEERTIASKKSTGRKRALSQAAAVRASDLLDGGELGGASQVAKQLITEGLASHLVHKSTVIRAAKEAARKEGCQLKAEKRPPRKGLTQATKEKRLAFAQENSRTAWSRVMFTDRKRFYFRYPGSKVQPTRWNKTGLNRPKKPGVYRPNHPQCLNVYGGITRYGVSKLHEVAGSSKHRSSYRNKKGDVASNITLEEYGHVLDDTLLPEGKRIFGGQGISSWKLQQDNDRAHGKAAARVAEWRKKNASMVRLLPDWPPNSPDLNLIENVWAYVQGKVDALGCQSFEEFKNAVHHQFAVVPLSMLRNL
jgi:transposase